MHPIIQAFLLSGVFCWAAFRLKALSLSGCLAAVILGTVILGLGGWNGVYPLLAFFVSSSLLSKARARGALVLEEARGTQRDAVQVLVNGGVAGFVVLLGAVARLDLYPIYLGALAAANADTWSTEIGIMLGKNPRSIISGKPVTAGTSGGVTISGTIGALLGAILIAWVGRLSLKVPIESNTLLIITLAGLGGSLFDSILGAAFQARRRCHVCSKETEKKSHCGQPTDFAGGLRWLDNDGVNFLCTTCGASIAAFLGQW